MEALNEEGTRASDPVTEGSDAIARRRAGRTFGDYIGLYVRGFCMGSADVVPGVSGGTMAFILGIYEELILSIRAVARPEFLRPLLTFRWGKAQRVLNWPFLLAVLAGIATAVLTLAKGLAWMLVHQPILVWSFFFGLVLASVVTVSRRVKRWTALLAFLVAAGAVGAYIFVGLVPVQTPETWWFLFLSGAVAICAMILPGISGAFVLVLLGKYQHVLAAVNDRDLGYLFFICLGAMVGIVTFAQVLGWLFRKFHDPTVAVLTGLMLGSLRKVWPWKVQSGFIIGSHGKRIPTVENNVLPPFMVHGTFNREIAVAIGLAVLGLVVVLVLEWWANRKEAS
ncbi:MAG: DUF368 domain-containing protein [Thermoanaerobaculia bacterium]